VADDPAGRIDPAAIANAAVRVLAALNVTAARSRRGESYVAEALAVAKLEIDPPLLRAALMMLLAERCIERPVQLADGDVVVIVIRPSLPRPGAPRFWPVDDP